jgi:hypothetical protein
MAKRGFKDICDKLQKAHEILLDILDDVQEKRDSIDDKAMEHNRDYTDAEQEAMDALDEVESNVDDAVTYIEEAMDACGY